MTVFVSLARRRGDAPVTPPPDPPPPIAGDQQQPYPMPTAAPYNVWTPAITPTADGTGSTAHPSVVDFGQITPTGLWNGWRYWMAHTPYYMSGDQRENPEIIASNNGYHWHQPAGISNPLYPPPGGSFNSDTDLEYDPENDLLWLLYRGKVDGALHRFLYASSGDGVTWPATASLLDWAPPILQEDPLSYDQCLSPCLVRRGAGDWWLFTIRASTKEIIASTSTSPGVSWSAWTTVNVTPTGIWHFDVIWDGAAFRCLIDKGPEYLGAPDGYLTGSSLDGLSWSWSEGLVMDRPLDPNAWDSTQLYRASIQPHENGTHYRLWYSAEGSQSWRVGYSWLPRSLWPAPPA